MEEPQRVLKSALKSSRVVPIYEEEATTDDQLSPHQQDLALRDAEAHNMELSGDWQIGPEGRMWSVDEVKILYLIALHARPAISSDESESWIRQLPLWVLLYEGVAEGIIDADYAPASVLVPIPGFGSKRMWLNISQESKSYVDNLREVREYPPTGC